MVREASAARDVQVVGEMDDPQPYPSQVLIRVAFSGVNPGDVKKREDAFGVECYIRVSFLTVTVPAPLMQWAKGVKGTTVYCAVVPIESPPSSPKRLIYVACGFDLRFGWHIIAADEEESRVHKDKLPDRSLWHLGYSWRRSRWNRPVLAVPYRS